MDQLAAQARHGPGRAAPAQLHPARRLPAQDGRRRHLRLRRVRARAGARARGGAATTSCAPSRRSGASAATSSSSGSACAPTSSCTGFGVEVGTCTVDEDGIVTVKTGTSPQGQGHETTWAQLVSWTLGVPMDDVRVDALRHAQGPARHGHDGLALAAGRRQRDDQRHPRGAGQGQRARGAPARGRRRATSQVVPGQGLGVAGTPSATISVGRAGQGGRRPRRAARGHGAGPRRDQRLRDARTRRYPFGAHVAVVEVDTETGLAKLIRHVTVDDSGSIANPLLVEGQIHGGIAQGVAQALYEEIAYDEDGNCVTGSLTSYAMPTAAELPMFETARTETPSPLQPAGRQGHRRVGRDRRHARRVERRRRRPVAPGRREHRHAGDAACGCGRRSRRRGAGRARPRRAAVAAHAGAVG